ncbi:MAG: hypothetical protein KGL59_14275, partial [Acidobacteriota bacterium]|nr:hypothetical protein [Acidobacteriota bacterium]
MGNTTSIISDLETLGGFPASFLDRERFPLGMIGLVSKNFPPHELRGGAILDIIRHSMSANTSPRRQKLEAFVAAHPNDAFGRYGLAMECVREGDNETAAGHFRQLLESHPDYVAGYFHYG